MGKRCGSPKRGQYEKGLSAPTLELLLKLKFYSGRSRDWIVTGGEGGMSPASSSMVSLRNRVTVNAAVVDIEHRIHRRRCCCRPGRRVPRKCCGDDLAVSIASGSPDSKLVSFLLPRGLAPGQYFVSISDPEEGDANFPVATARWSPSCGN